MKNIALIVLVLVVSFTHVAAQPQENISPGWVNLFDGKTLNGWKILAGTAKYQVEGDAIVGITVPKSRNTFLVAEKLYGDFILEMEVKLQDTTINSGNARSTCNAIDRFKLCFCFFFGIIDPIIYQ